MPNQLPNSNDPAEHDRDHTSLTHFDNLDELLEYFISDEIRPVAATESEPTVTECGPYGTENGPTGTEDEPIFVQGDPIALQDDSFTYDLFSHNVIFPPQHNQVSYMDVYNDPYLQGSSGESSNSSLSSSPSFSFHQSCQSTPNSEYYSLPPSTPPPPSPSPPVAARRTREFNGATLPRRSNPVRSNGGGHTCPLCDRIFFCLRDTIRHILSHSDNRNDGSHPCPLCDGTYSREQDVKRHLLSHFDIRNELCSHCPKTFKRHDSLIRHQKKCNSKNRIRNNR
ncbi:hypothetical protein BDF21DRAFT_419054 [Thamnidium elegans]|nr:hypothetical protein BDF21DRAFT_419054 [Thamnidium elegans]